MFDCSLSELAVVLVVTVLVLKPEDLPGILKAFKGFRRQVGAWKQQVTDSIADMDTLQALKAEYHAIEGELKTITDLNGNPQQAYDIQAIQREIDKMMANVQKPPAAGKDSSEKK